MLTCDAIADLAIERVSEFTKTYPKSRASMFRRIGVRQQQLVLVATDANQDYYGVVSTANVDHASGDRVDLADIADPVPTPEQIQRVEVNAISGGGPAIGTNIAIVPLGDLNAEDAPRATLRHQILKGVGADLALVNEIRVYYALMPKAYLATDGATATEIPAPHDELLVVDLAMWLVNAARGIDPTERDKALGQLANEETGLLEGWKLHVERSIPMTSRFTRPPHAARKEADNG